MTALLSPLRHETDRVRIVGKLTEIADATMDVVAGQDRITVACSPDGGHIFEVAFAEPLLHGDGVYDSVTGHLTRTAFRNLAERLQIPLTYLDRLTSSGHCTLSGTNINTLAGADGRTALYRMLRTEDGWTLRSVQSDTYKAIDNGHLLAAVVKGLGDTGINLGDCNVEADWTNDRFRLRVSVPAIELAVPDLLADYRTPWSMNPNDPTHAPNRGGDVPPVLFAGLEIANSETGGGAATIAPRAEVLICRNGLTRVQDIVRNVHLGGKLDKGVIEWSHATYKASLELITSQIADAARKFTSIEYLTAMADEMRKAKGIAVESPTAAVAKVVDKMGFTEDEHKSILDCFIRSADTTLLGLGQAVTAAAQLAEDGDRQAEMEATFFAIVNQPELARA